MDVHNREVPLYSLLREVYNNQHNYNNCVGSILVLHCNFHSLDTMSIMNINVINICIANVFCRVSHLRQMLTQMQYLKFCTVKSNNYYRQYIASYIYTSLKSLFSLDNMINMNINVIIINIICSLA